LHRRRDDIPPEAVRVHPGNPARGSEPEAAVRSLDCRRQGTYLRRRRLDAVAVVEAFVRDSVSGVGKCPPNVSSRNADDANSAVEPELTVRSLNDARHAAKRLTGHVQRDEWPRLLRSPWLERSHPQLTSDPDTIATHRNGEYAPNAWPIRCGKDLY
jgi:hypothetical protein